MELRMDLGFVVVGSEAGVDGREGVEMFLAVVMWRLPDGNGKCWWKWRCE